MKKSRLNKHSIGSPSPTKAFLFDEPLIYSPRSHRKPIRWTHPMLAQSAKMQKRIDLLEKQCMNLREKTTRVQQIHSKTIDQNAKLNAGQESLKKETQKLIAFKEKVLSSDKGSLFFSYFQNIENKLNAFKKELTKYIQHEKSRVECTNATNRGLQIQTQREKERVDSLERECVQSREELHKMEIKLQKVKSHRLSDRSKMNDAVIKMQSEFEQRESEWKKQQKRLSIELKSMTKDSNQQIDPSLVFKDQKPSKLNTKSNQFGKQGPVILELLIKELKSQNHSKDSLLTKFETKMGELKKMNKEMHKKLVTERKERLKLVVKTKEDEKTLERLKKKRNDILRENKALNQQVKSLNVDHEQREGKWEEKRLCLLIKMQEMEGSIERRQKEMEKTQSQLDAMKSKLHVVQREKEESLHQQHNQHEQRESEWNEERKGLELKIKESLLAKQRHVKVMDDFLRKSEMERRERLKMSKENKEKMDDLRKQRDVLMERQQQTSAVIANIESEKSDLLDTLHSMNHKLADSQRKGESLQLEFNQQALQWEEEERSLRMKMEEMKKSNESIREELESERQQRITKGEITEMEKLNLSIERKQLRNEAIEQKREVSNVIAQLQEGMTTQKTKLTHAQQERDSLKLQHDRRISEWKEDRRGLTMKIEAFSELERRHERAMNDLQRLKENMISHENSHITFIERLRNENRVLREKSKSFHEEMKKLRLKGEILNKQIDVETEEMTQKFDQTITRSLSTFKQVVNEQRSFECEEKILSLRVKLEEMGRSNERLQEESEKIQSQMDAMKSKLDDVQREKESLHQLHQQHEQRESEWNEERKCLEMKMEEILLTKQSKQSHPNKVMSDFLKESEMELQEWMKISSENEEQLLDLRKQRDELMEKQQQTSVVIENIESEKKDLLDTVHSLQYKLADSQREGVSHQLMLRQRELQWETEKRVLTLKLDEMENNTVNELQATKEENTQLRDKLSGSIEQWRAGIRKARNNVKSVKKEYREQQKELKQFRSSIRGIKGLCKKWHKDIPQIWGEIGEIKDEYHYHQQHLQEELNQIGTVTQLLVKQYQESKQWNRKMKGQIERMKEERDEIEDVLRIKESELQNVIQRMESAEEKKMEMEQSIDERKERTRDIIGEKHEMIKDLAFKNKELQKYITALKLDADQQSKRFQQRIAEIEKDDSEEKLLEEELMQIRIIKAEVIGQLQAKEVENEKLRRALNKYKQEADQEIDSNEKYITRIEQQRKVLLQCVEKNKNQLISSKAECAATKKRLVYAGQIENELRSRVESLTIKTNQITNLLRDLQRVANERQDELKAQINQVVSQYEDFVMLSKKTNAMMVGKLTEVGEDIHSTGTHHEVKGIDELRHQYIAEIQRLKREVIYNEEMMTGNLNERNGVSKIDRVQQMGERKRLREEVQSKQTMILELQSALEERDEHLEEMAKQVDGDNVKIQELGESLIESRKSSMAQQCQFQSLQWKIKQMEDEYEKTRAHVAILQGKVSMYRERLNSEHSATSADSSHWII